VPRPNNRVKFKHLKVKHPSSPASTAVSSVSLGAIDVHFHGAFGIDLMTASPEQLDELSDRMWKEGGVAGFCATTLSAPRKELKEAVARLGQWITAGRFPGAAPLGIHLEGPFIHPHACGAHPPGTLRALSFKELEELWKASQGTLKILTVAPEQLDRSEITRLVRWSKDREINLSLGHSRATPAQAKQAFDRGFRCVTHAWNALNFHHRDPGVMGAALGREDIYLELIGDQVHVSKDVMNWTRRLHPESKLLLVSDCVPAAGTRGGGWTSFGPLKIRFSEGACRLENGALAGGGILLPQAFAQWVKDDPVDEQRRALRMITHTPLHYLGIPARRLHRHRLKWSFQEGQAPRFEPEAL
jgi:N-acetylglucosamine-6-phosphate deacetylase